jgi:hypothetical protein
VGSACNKVQEEEEGIFFKKKKKEKDFKNKKKKKRKKILKNKNGWGVVSESMDLHSTIVFFQAFRTC